ncbi:diketogulonate reductase-like aldo/keto reductase [Herbihabitans rhizosphaerae]|uniref:Diketogulonate reductase-like aldo/keto reductase n=1 Tax=Herbihabitans rhizosphaerae TaxID=1872711 RepID=A0A4Q7KGE7_9PSEU|nr:aldo/keto reductase [Herbihabitans rhizosphaerae]RZS31232.1 diketogulonate reductase-like aldo/keto reductase [Herbihabitans rhizosphaerae]
MTIAPTVKLRDGNEMPVLGFGTWPMDDAQSEVAVSEALRLGYRLVDTAAKYGNESGVGAGVRTSGVPREQVFVTTKLRGSQHGYDEALAGFEESRARLGLDYVDLYLIHWPLPGIDKYVDSWRAFVELRDRGLVRSIGVSNFTPDQMDRLTAETGVTPAVNQIEMHLDFPQDEMRAWHTEHDVVTESWRPFGRGPLSRKEVLDVAEARGCTPAQILLRWHHQLGAVPIPKSGNPERMAQNLAIFDFTLTEEEMTTLSAASQAVRLGGEPTTHVEL